MVISCTKNSLNNINESIEINVSGFENTENVQIELFEIHGPNEAHGDDNVGDLIATFNGSIEKADGNCKFKSSGSPTIPNYDNGTTFPASVNVKFLGSDTIYPVRVPFAHAEREGDTLEFSLRLRAGSINIECQNAATIPLVQKQGIILTFITGTDHSANKYFDFANGYWNYRYRSDKVYLPSASPDYLTVADIVTKIDAFKTELQRVNSTLPEDQRKKIGQINIVAHGNPNGINLMPSATTSGDGSYGNRIDSLNVNDKLQAVTRELTIDPKNQFNRNDNVQIVFRGCNIGHSNNILNGFKNFWGNNVTVKAPMFTQIYSSVSGRAPLNASTVPVEYFVIDYTVHISEPGTLVNNRNNICDKLFTKYGGYTLDEWKEKFDNADTTKRFYKNESFDAVVQYNQEMTEDKMIQNYWAQQSREVENYVLMHDNYDDWNWGTAGDCIGIRYLYKGTYSTDEYIYNREWWKEYAKDERREYPPAPGAPVDQSFDGISGSKYSWVFNEEKDVALHSLKKYRNVNSRIVHLRIDYTDNLGNLIMPDLNRMDHYGTAS